MSSFKIMKSIFDALNGTKGVLVDDNNGQNKTVAAIAWLNKETEKHVVGLFDDDYFMPREIYLDEQGVPHLSRSPVGPVIELDAMPGVSRMNMAQALVWYNRTYSVNMCHASYLTNFFVLDANGVLEISAAHEQYDLDFEELEANVQAARAKLREVASAGSR